METRKEFECQNQKNISKQEFDDAINELNDYLVQIWSINNILRLLYDVLRCEKTEIARVSSAILPCVWQLDYIYNHSDKLLDTIMDYRI